LIGTSWVPGALVLAVGLIAGWVFARQLRRGVAPAKGRNRDRDRALEITDLEARRDELYERLREPDLNPVDREDLEKAAARTLQRLDELGARRLERTEPERPAEEEPAPAAAASASQARPFVLGFAYGIGLILVVGALIYWAVRDAKPTDDGQPAPMAGAQTDDPHADLADLSPEAAAMMQALTARLQANPGDVDARRELALLLLSIGRFFEAFEEAETVLAAVPEDSGALYVQAVVRLTMGQIEPGTELLERALASNPRHLESLIARGIVHLQSGDQAQALALWERGLEEAGGEHQGLERLIAMTRAGRPVEEILRAPRPGDVEGLAEGGETPPATAPDPAPPVAAAPRPSPAPAAAGEIGEGDYGVRIVLAPGARAPAGAILFIYLRAGESGAPVAVRRISNPAFPLDMVLGAGDSMMGAELPPTGNLVAKLDSDGSASTSDPGDLETVAPATAGTRTLLTLGL
jgi:cytochrome c-type biogenesis protein CcmH